MNNILKINFLKRKRPTTVLALALDGSQLDGVVMRRTNGSVQLLQSFSATLTLDPLTSDAELVGREIRNHLDAAGVRERHCLVCVPLKWAMTAHTEIPELPEADVPGFLQIEAERGFHSDAETLHFAVSRYSFGGKQQATLVAVPRNHVVVLEKILRAAKLKPLSFSLGIAALQPPAAEASNCVLALMIGQTNVGLQITCGGGVAALRALEGALEIEGSRRTLHADVIAREARITLGQLPVELRDKVRTVRIFGPRDLAQQLADEVELRLEQMGLKVEVVKNYSPGEFGVQLPADAMVSSAFSFAVEFLTDREPFVEFLPPKIPAWKQVASKYASGKARTAIAAAAAVLVILVGLFSYQQVRIIRWQSRWDQMKTEVADLRAMQEKIQQYRPWSDESVRGLTILKQLTAAFPEDGAVTAKTVEIRELNTVVCTGIAQNRQALLRVLENLRKSEGVADVKIVQSRGSPVQFTFNVLYNQGEMHAN